MVLFLADIVSMVRQRKNFNDLMLELSGISGKTPRFLTREQIERIREEAGSVSHETLREHALREYVEFCDRVQRQIHAVNRAITRALLKSQQRLEEAREALEDIRRRATVDEKGRKVYRTADGTKAFTDDGQQLTPEEMASIKWDPMAPTWEQKVEAEERWKQAAEEHESILRARQRADYYSQRMASGDLLSRDELETIHQDLNAMPEAGRAEMPGKMAEAMNAPLSEEFALSTEEVAGIKPECVSAPDFPLNFPC